MLHLPHFLLLPLVLLVTCVGAGLTGAQPQQVQSTDQAAAKERRVGEKFTATMQELPAPYEGPIVRNAPLTVPRAGWQPQLPDGFAATLYADNLENPRQILILPNGDVLVALQKSGSLMMLRDDNRDGRADWVEHYAGGFNQPYGLTHREEELLIADQDGIWRLGYKPGALRPPSVGPKAAAEVPPHERKPEPRMDGQLLTEKGVFGIVQGHRNRDLEIGPNGRLYVGVGSVGNIGIEPEPKTTIQSFAASGKDQQTYATGMRNPTGLTFHPDTGALWAVVQERDGLGDRLVPDYLARVQPGGFYGYPYSYIGTHPQPGFAERAPEQVARAITPEMLFEPHSSVMDLVFYTGTMFPKEYQGDAFVAMKGSWNRSIPTGYKVVRVKFSNGQPIGWYENFMTGFWVEGDERALVWGRPADVALAPDGALFVVDDTGGTLWRVTYTKSMAAQAQPQQ